MTSDHFVVHFWSIITFWMQKHSVFVHCGQKDLNKIRVLTSLLQKHNVFVQFWNTNDIRSICCSFLLNYYVLNAKTKWHQISCWFILTAALSSRQLTICPSSSFELQAAPWSSRQHLELQTAPWSSRQLFGLPDNSRLVLLSSRLFFGAPDTGVAFCSKWKLRTWNLKFCKLETCIFQYRQTAPFKFDFSIFEPDKGATLLCSSLTTITHFQLFKVTHVCLKATSVALALAMLMWSDRCRT